MKSRERSNLESQMAVVLSRSCGQIACRHHRTSRSVW